MRRRFFAFILAMVFLFILSGKSWCNEFCVCSISEFENALSEAESNFEDDVVKVEQGIYEGNFSSISQRFSITLLGGYTTDCVDRVLNPENTVIDGGDAGVGLSIITMGGPGNITVDGFTIQNSTRGLYISTSDEYLSGTSGNISITNNKS